MKFKFYKIRLEKIRLSRPIPLLIAGLFAAFTIQCEANLTGDDQDLLRGQFLLTAFSGSCAEVIYSGPGNYGVIVKPIPPALCSRSSFFGATYAESVQNGGAQFQKMLETLNILDGTGTSCPGTRAALSSYISNPQAAVTDGVFQPEADYNNRRLFPLPESMKDFATDTVLANFSDGGVTRTDWNSAIQRGYAEERRAFSVQILFVVIGNQGENGCLPATADSLAAMGLLFPGYLWNQHQDPNTTPQRQIISFPCTYGSNVTTNCLYDLPEFID